MEDENGDAASLTLLGGLLVNFKRWNSSGGVRWSDFGGGFFCFVREFEAFFLCLVGVLFVLVQVCRLHIAEFWDVTVLIWRFWNGSFCFCSESLGNPGVW